MSFLADVRSTRARMQQKNVQEEPQIQVPLAAVRKALLETSERVDQQAAEVIHQQLASYNGVQNAHEEDVTSYERALTSLEEDERRLDVLLKEKMRILQDIAGQRQNLTNELLQIKNLASGNQPTYLQTKLLEGGKVFSSLAASKARQGKK